MVKGVERRTVHIRTAESEIFEEAIFVLKSDYNRKRVGERDVFSEAARILEEADCGLGVKAGAEKREDIAVARPRITPFGVVCGLLCGMGSTGLLWLILALA